MTTLLVEDNVIARDAYAHLLAENALAPQVCGELNEAIGFCRKRCDLQMIIMGFDMAGGTTMQGLSTLKEHSLQTPIVIASGDPTAEAAFAALDAGAAGYVPKTMSRDCIANALKLVLAGERFMPSLAISGWQNITSYLQDRSTNRIDPGNLSGLTPRQLEVLRLLAKGASNKMIARALSLHEVTVKSHMKGIFRCMGVNSRTEAVRKAMLAGIEAFEEEDQQCGLAIFKKTHASLH